MVRNPDPASLAKNRRVPLPAPVTLRMSAGPVTVERFITAAAAAQAVAQCVVRMIRSKPASVLGLATGRTFVSVYDALAAAWSAGEVSFADATTFNLDEYCAIAADHPGSFNQYMRNHLFDRIDLKPENRHLPSPDPEQGAGDRYEAAIAASGGIDLQLLGLGRNGHIGFNEPGSALSSRTRIVALAEETRRANARDFPTGCNTPERAITMGIGTILEARRIVVLATGPEKSGALRAAISGPVGPHNPASFLRLHPDVTIMADAESLPFASGE